MFSMSEHRGKTCFDYVERRKQLGLLEYVVARKCLILMNYSSHLFGKRIKMKKNIPLFVAWLLLATSVAPVQSQEIIAHRGYWRIDGSAQNSIAALMKADSIRAYGSEVDIWLSSDGVPVVNHDADVTLDGEKLIVQDTPFATLRKVKLANGEPLPTMEEYLDAFSNCTHTKLIIEFKTHRSKESESELAAKVVNMVNERELQNRVEYISLGLHFVQQVKKLAHAAPVYYLNGDLA